MTTEVNEPILEPSSDEIPEEEFSCEEIYNGSILEASCNGTLFPQGTNDSMGLLADVYYFYSTVQFTVLCILFISILVGNTSVISALVLSKARKSRTNFFIMHLAIADLLVGLLSVLTDLIWKITVSWNAGNILCKAIKFAVGLVTYSSTYVLVALSIDRYDAITHPMNFSGSWKRARYLIKIAWLLSAVFASPSIYLFKETEIKGLPQCWIAMEDWQWKVYVTMVTLMVFVIPFVIITACYFVIVYTIWSKSKMMTMNETNIRSSQNGNKRSVQLEDDSRRASSRGLIPKAKIKTVKMTFVIVFVFVLCWSPYFVFNLLQVFHFLPNTTTTIALSTLFQSLAPLNSAANPIIYCLFSTHLCRNLRRIWGLDALGRVLCPCCTCTRPQFDLRAPLQRSGVESTSMSEISSKRRTLSSSVRSFSRYMRVRQPIHSKVTMKNQRQCLDIELLNQKTAFDLPQEQDTVEGSAV